jgi:membrane protein
MRFLARLIVLVAGRFREQRCSQIAASLAFTTLLSIVPTLAVALAVVSRLPVSARLSSALQGFLLGNLLPDKAGQVIARYIVQFSHRANELTLLGTALLVLTAFFLTLTIDHTFNSMWLATRRRPWAKRITVHALVMVLGPVLLGAGLAAATFVVSTSLGWVDEPPWVRAMIYRLLPVFFLTAAFALLFYAVPNRPVRVLDAVAGAVVAMIGLLLVQRLFGLYVARIPTYDLIYGAFAAVPVFLVWLYLCWTVVLVGALVSAILPEVEGMQRSGAG